MQQPIYWPDKLPSNPNTYQKAYDSLKLKASQGGHPNNDIDDIFGKGYKICICLISKLRLNFVIIKVCSLKCHDFICNIVYRLIL